MKQKTNGRVRSQVMQLIIFLYSDKKKHSEYKLRTLILFKTI